MAQEPCDKNSIINPDAETPSVAVLKYQQEVARLKEFLLQLDREIEDEGQRCGAQIAQLERTLAERDVLIEDLRLRLAERSDCHRQHPRDDDDNDDNDDNDTEDLVAVLEEENDKLKDIVGGQEKAISELAERSSNLQAALTLLQANIREEIAMGLMESQKQTSALEAQLQQANTAIVELTTKHREGTNDGQLVEKLTRDLDARNYLIDQLNEEINTLKGRIEELTRGEASHGRDGLVDKAYMRALLMNLAHPPPKVDRMEIWTLLSRTLGMNEDELRRVGVRLVAAETSKDEGTGIRQGLSDVWISFLLNEAGQNENGKDTRAQM